MSELEERKRVSDIALSWVGTKFHDNAEVKGAGVDCARLIKCVFQEAQLVEPFCIGHYSAQHFHHSTEERFIGWLQRYAREIKQDEALVGDIVVYKIGRVYSHGGIIVEPGLPRIVHAWYPARKVLQAGYLDGILRYPRLAPRFFTRW